VPKAVGPGVAAGGPAPGGFGGPLWGGEFVIILPHTDTQGAIAVAKHIRQLLADLALPHRSVPQQHVTLSMGIATGVPQPQRFSSALIAAADHALYQAKTSGRDTYYVADDGAIALPNLNPQTETQDDPQA